VKFIQISDKQKLLGDAARLFEGAYFVTKQSRHSERCRTTHESLLAATHSTTFWVLYQ